MPSIFTLMEAAKEKGVRHTAFCQDNFTWLAMERAGKGKKLVKRDKGVCAGLCIRWIKSAHPHGLIERFTANAARMETEPSFRDFLFSNVEEHTLTEEQRKLGYHRRTASIVRYQQQSVDLKGRSRDPKFGSTLPARDDRGGFGSREVRFLRGETYFLRRSELTNQEGHGCASGEELRTSVAEAVASDRQQIELAALIDLDFENVGLPSHNVAVRASSDKAMFFDPNGGVLTFRRKEQLRQWFIDELGKVDGPSYDKADMRVLLYSYAV